MYYHPEIIAVSCSQRGWGEFGAELVWWSAGEPVRRPGGQGGAGRGSRIPAHSWSCWLVLRIVSEQQEVSKGRRSKNKSLCGGLATQELDLL